MAGPWRIATWDRDLNILFLWLTANRSGLIYNVKDKEQALEYIANSKVDQQLVFGSLYSREIKSLGEVRTR